MLAERYRIVGLLGRGGMGEVYRADDLVLGQSVALKFLPARLADDEQRLSGFVQEVRIARQVSHPNVCRVYDIGTTDGIRFLSMEYIDGEDLASLLRRIGRLPHDKAIDIARQLCAGLAAAHERGILHRDLKPANVMIDGRGKVRITDFGLAALAADLATSDSSGGTPAYMAPEQLAGESATVRTDIYALGLVLYEMFTGKQTYRAETLAELTQLIRNSTPKSPSTIITDLDPATERIILRCLEKDPENRPGSAFAVSAALPGGDPLAAALAAGETPSPELVAASGEVGAIRPLIAWLSIAVIAAGLLAIAHLNVRTRLHERVPLEKPPQVLADRATDILRALGHSERPAGQAQGFLADSDLLRYIREHDESADRWDRLAAHRPAPIRFWYRTSPQSLATVGLAEAVTPLDPPHLVPGMTTVVLDPSGRLTTFGEVPPTLIEADSTRPALRADLGALFAAAGIDTTRLAPVTPIWTPDVYADTLMAWTVNDSAAFGGNLRIEAASFGGKPVHFLVSGPWRRSWREPPPTIDNRLRRIRGVEIAMILGMLGGAIVLAVRNLRLGRVDRKGAFNIFAVIMATSILSWIFGASHVSAADEELELFMKALGPAIFMAGALWLMYIALEPYMRRHFPHRLIGWSRLCAGRLRDPLVGRNVLVGVVAGVVIVLLSRLAPVLPVWFGHPPDTPAAIPGTSFNLLQHIGQLFELTRLALFNGLFFLIMPLLLQVIFRNYRLSIAVFFVMLSVLFTLREPHPELEWPLMILMTAVWIWMMMRYGLLALAVNFYVMVVLETAPITTDLSAWYAVSAVPALLVVGGIAVYGLVVALAGRSLLDGTAFLRD